MPALHPATHDADTLDGLAGKRLEFAHHVRVTARETAENDGGQFRRPFLLGKARGAQPGVDAFHHVPRSKISGCTRLEVRPLGGSL